MTWAACCLTFFGFLHVSEFTIPFDDLFNQGCYLCLSDIAIDNQDNPKTLQVKIKQSKTDPFCKGVNIYLGVTERDLCPLRGILPYLALRGNRSGPLFMLSDGRGLSQQLFKAALDNLLSALNMDKGKCNTHSFRIGAATSAKQANIPDTYIQMLGHCRSNAYQHYIKTPPQELAKLSIHITDGYPLPSMK